jgi:hypothetical protein
MNENKLTEIKEAVNQFLWQRLPDKTTLKDAEWISCNIYQLIVNEYQKYEVKNEILD